MTLDVLLELSVFPYSLSGTSVMFCFRLYLYFSEDSISINVREDCVSILCPQRLYYDGPQRLMAIVR